MASLVMGYRPGDLARGVGTMAGGYSRATYLGKTTQPLWVRRGGVRMGRNQSATAWAAPCLWAGSSATSGPGTLLARTATQPLTTFMASDDRATGRNVEADVIASVLVPAGTHLYGGPWVSSGDISHGQDNSGATMWQRTGMAGAPPSPFGGGSLGPQGRIDTWWIFDTNITPGMPTVITPANGSVTVDPSLDITIRFVDANPGDRVAKWLIELYDSTNTSLLVTSGVQDATSGQRASGEVTWNPGTIAVRPYRGRAYMWDDANAKSQARVWSFTINSGGTATSLTLATGAGDRDDVRVYNTGRPASVTATWTHDSGEHTAHWDWRIVDADTGAIVRATVGGDFDVAPDATLSPNFVPAWADLPAGTRRYAWEVQTTDALGGVSGWVRSPVFIINAAPTVTLTAPADGSYTAQLPVVRLTMADVTDEPASLVHVVEIREKSGPGPWLAIPANRRTRDGTTVTAQASTPEVPAYGAYEVRATITDPWGLAVTSAIRTVNYVAPPAVTITAPVGTIATGTPTVTATVDRSIATYRVTVENAFSREVAYDSGDVVGTGTTISEVIPAGIIRNQTDYRTLLDVTTTDTLSVHVEQEWRLEYVPDPPMTGVTLATGAASIFDGGEYPQEPNIGMGWDRVGEATVSDTDLIGIVIRRYIGDIKQREWLIPNREVTALVDRSPASGELYRYTASYRKYVNAGADVVESEPVELPGLVTILHTTITSETGDRAATLKYWRSRRVPQVIDVEARVPLGRSTPYAFQSATSYDTVRGTFRPKRADDGSYDAQQLVEAMRALAAPEPLPDGTTGPQALWYRDPHRCFRFAFTKGIEADDQHTDDWTEIDVEGVEVTSPELLAQWITVASQSGGGFGEDGFGL